jgi:P pilus assembly chaperone PapD
MRRDLVLALALALAASGAPATAQPSSAATGALLNITPKRLVFDRAHRNGVVFLLNQGAAPVTVDVGLVDRVMLPDGQIAPLDDAGRHDEVMAVAAGLKSARDLMQVSPRRVTLQPGRPQTVRVRLSTLPEAAIGEHRTHLTVMTLPPPDTGVTVESAAAGAGAGELRFQITAVYGLSIPLIVRPTDPEVAATLERARLEYAEPPATGREPSRRTAVVAFDVVRGGASSVYGNLEVRVVGAAKTAEPLGMARGVGVYPEIARRAVRIPLSRPPSAGERLEVTFTDDDTSPGKVLAKVVL